ncbi:glycosyltransferase family 2 protein [Caldisericum exile]|uniref:glycosyltransferase family 2 protein n=1 Tax=Caldisericum exile TaxID=693075 RepID=UPI003C752C93
MCISKNLLHKLADNLDRNTKHSITIPELKIFNSELEGEPGDKFKTKLFLPENPSRIAEGGLRTKGFFKFNYKLKILDNKLDEDIQNSSSKIQNLKNWFICDLDGNPITPAPDDIQKKITSYLSLDSQSKIQHPKSIIQHPKFNIQNFKSNIHHPTSNIQNLTSHLIELPLITVITVVFNGAKTLEETIKSVINQTYPNVEYIIIDGGSTDGTLDIIKKYEDQIDYWISEPDKGIYDAMNKGVTLALGYYIYFLGSDDVVFSSEVFSKILSLIKLDTKLIYGNVYFKESGKIYDGEFSKFKLCTRNICHQAILYSIYFFKKYGLYNLKYKILADYEFNLRVWEKSKAKYVDIILAIYSIEGNSSKSIDEKFLIDLPALIKNYFGTLYWIYYNFRKKIVFVLEKIGLKEKLKQILGR